MNNRTIFASTCYNSYTGTEAVETAGDRKCHAIFFLQILSALNMVASEQQFGGSGIWYQDTPAAS